MKTTKQTRVFLKSLAGLLVSSAWASAAETEMAPLAPREPASHAGGCKFFACCDPLTGSCQDLTTGGCEPPLVFYCNQTCADLAPPCGAGACCLDGGGCALVGPADCLPPSVFQGIGTLCSQPNPPCGLPGCGPCRLYGDFEVPFCVICAEDILAMLDAFAGNYDPFATDIYPCDGSCGAGVVDLDDWLAEMAVFIGQPDCPDPCPPGACCGDLPGDPPGPECRDQFTLPGAMSETDCSLLGGTYCGDFAFCGDPCPGGTCASPSSPRGQAAPTDGPGDTWICDRLSDLQHRSAVLAPSQRVGPDRLARR